MSICGHSGACRRRIGRPHPSAPVPCASGQRSSRGRRQGGRRRRPVLRHKAGRARRRDAGAPGSHRWKSEFTRPQHKAKTPLVCRVAAAVAGRRASSARCRPLTLPGDRHDRDRHFPHGRTRWSRDDDRRRRSTDRHRLHANIEGLGVAEHEFAISPTGGIVVDDRMRVSRSGIYAAGDVTGRDQFVYMAAYGAKLATKNALNGDSLRYDNSAMPTTVFTDPQVASVGPTEAAARPAATRFASQRSVSIRWRVRLRPPTTRGLIKLVADACSGKLLGAHVVAPEGADSIQTGGARDPAGSHGRRSRGDDLSVSHPRRGAKARGAGVRHGRRQAVVLRRVNPGKAPQPLRAWLTRRQRADRVNSQANADHGSLDCQDKSPSLVVAYLRRLGIAPELEPRPDHASYLASWLKCSPTTSGRFFRPRPMPNAQSDSLHDLQLGEVGENAAA